MNVLVGDLGGTKTILAIFSSDAGPREPLAESTFSSARYSSFEDIVREFLSRFDLPIDSACFAVAGPIRDGHAHITNLNWSVNSESIKSEFNLASVKLLNDLESVAYAIPILESKDIFTINTGKPLEHGTIAVLAPGTGLGEGFLTFDGNRYVAHASEGSHATFAPEDELQMGLVKYLKQRDYEHISFEYVCSGGFGIPILYEYLRETEVAPEPDWLAEKLSGSEDPTPIIFEAAHDREKPCKLASATVDMFIAILGAEGGNLALKVLSMGGLYLGGGIPPRILEELQSPMFLEAFRNKGRFRALLSDMPMHVILNSKAGLLGAAAYGLALTPA